MDCRYGVAEPYEKLKAFTRGNRVTAQSMQVACYLCFQTIENVSAVRIECMQPKHKRIVHGEVCGNPAGMLVTDAFGVLYVVFTTAHIICQQCPSDIYCLLYISLGSANQCQFSRLSFLCCCTCQYAMHPD